MEVLVIVFLLFLAVVFIWGMSGGVTRHQADMISQNVQILKRAAKDLWDAEHPEVHIDWPRDPAAKPEQGLVLDREHMRLAYVFVENGEWHYFSVDPERILAVELLIDNEMVSKVSRSRQVGGALVGGLLAGGAGAVIGGLSSGQRSTGEITRISIQLLLEGEVWEFCFWDRRSTNNWTGLNADQLRAVAASAKRWSLLLEEYLEKTSSSATGTSDPDAERRGRYCTHCGTEFGQGDVRFCSACGRPRVPSEAILD